MDAIMEGAVDPLAIDTRANGNANGGNDAATDHEKLQSELSEFVTQTEELKKLDQSIDQPDLTAEMLGEAAVIEESIVKGAEQMIADDHHAVPPEEGHQEYAADEHTHVMHVQETQEEMIHAEMAEIHQEHEEGQEIPVEDSVNDNANEITFHLEVSTGSTNSESDIHADGDGEGEMILEETTGEYVLASSLKPKTEIPEKKAKVEVDDTQTVIKLIEENLRSGEMQPGEQIVVVTSDERGNTKEVVLTHQKTVTENGMTVQHVVDEAGEVYLIENVDSAEEVEEEEEIPNVQTRPKRTQKKLQIPNHVLGRNIINPVEDTFRNGKAPPKPRLGVKIPYRNLTSQIVSKQEIAEEILERSRRFTRENPRQNMFARKLTQNLAKKLQPKDAKAMYAGATRGKARAAAKAKKDSDKLDNSDLLAILEGDDGTTESTASNESHKDSKEAMTAEMEREIALKQLSELPDDPEPPRAGERDGERIEKKAAGAVKSPFAGSAPLKTYGRKRKMSEDVPQPPTNPKPSSPSKQESPSKTTKATTPPNPEPAQPATPRATRSTPAPDAANNYVTKSSRVIKRKVIWDPDETSPKKGAKADAVAATKDAAKKDEGGRPARKAPHEVKKDYKAVAKVAESKKPDGGRKTSVPDVQLKEEPVSDSETDAPELEKPATPVKVKRRLNEVSKLLMDEGAVNMLYSIKNDDAPTTRVQKSQQSKADEILNELSALHSGSPDRASPKALRKKDVMTTPATPKAPRKIMLPPTPSPISRQKSKDSNRSSVHSPPPSPGHSFGGIESRIIRRHSSSSYSSMGEEDDGDERRVKKVEGGRGRRRALHGVTDSDKKKAKVETKTATGAKPVGQIKSKNDHFESLVEIKLLPSEAYSKYKKFTVSSLNKLVQIDLKHTLEEESNVYLTHELMSELIAILADLEADKNVNVVLITSRGSIFCDGINFKSMVIAKEAARKTAAKKLAKCVNEFLLCLARFPKVLAAGVHGDSFGLGVTMLPLFDMIIAHEDACFTIPNAKLGCIAEGGSLLLLPHLSRNVLVNELLYSSQTMSAQDALKLGLVTKILTKNTFARELLSTVKGVSDKSAQFMVSTKKQLRKRMIPDITNSLDDETENLVEQWTSDECQKSFAEYFDAE